MWVDHVLYTCFSWLHTLEEASRTQAQWASLGFLGLGSEISELLGTSYWVQRPIPRDLLLKQRVTEKLPPWWRARGWRGLG